MTNKPDFTAFLQTQGNARRFSAPLAYMKFMDGSHVGAIFLEHMLFWYSKGSGKDGWFYKSAKEWYAETGLSTDSVKRYTKMLVQLGVLETKLYPANGAPTTHFRLDAEKLYAILVEALSNQAKDDGPEAQGKTTISHWLETPKAFDDTDKTIWAKPRKEKIQEDKPEPFDENPKSITASEYTLKSKQEGDNYVISPEFEKLNSDTPPESVSPVMVSGSNSDSEPCNVVMSTDSVYMPVEPVTVSESDVVKVNSAGALHNVVPATNTVFAELLPVEPTPVKVKPKKAAATKTPKPPKEPKPPRELNTKELAFLAKIEQLNPPIAPDVKERLDEYSRSIPWSVAQVFLLTGYMPRPNNWHAITSLNGVAFNEELMMECYNEWTLRSYHERGLGWLLQWYKAGGPPARYGQHPVAAQATQQKTKIEISDPRVEDFAQWIIAKPGYGSKSPRSIQLAAWAVVNSEEQTHLGNAEELFAKYLAEKGIGSCNASYSLS